MATTTRTFAKAIYDHFKSDQSAGSAYALTGGRLYETRAPSNATWPYAVFFQVSGVPERHMGLTGDIQRWQFSIVSKEKSDMQEAKDIEDAYHTLYDAASFTMTGSGLTTYTLTHCKVIAHDGPRRDGDRTMATVDIEIRAQEQ